VLGEGGLSTETVPSENKGNREIPLLATIIITDIWTLARVDPSVTRQGRRLPHELRIAIGNYIAERLSTANPLAIVGSFTGMHSNVNGQGTPLNERLFAMCAFKGSFIGVDTPVPGEIRPTAKGLQGVSRPFAGIRVPLCSPPTCTGTGARLVDYLRSPDRLIQECPFDGKGG
jgi:hypothetical protein